MTLRSLENVRFSRLLKNFCGKKFFFKVLFKSHRYDKVNAILAKQSALEKKLQEQEETKS